MKMTLALHIRDWGRAGGCWVIRDGGRGKRGRTLHEALTDTGKVRTRAYCAFSLGESVFRSSPAAAAAPARRDAFPKAGARMAPFFPHHRPNMQHTLSVLSRHGPPRLEAGKKKISFSPLAAGLRAGLTVFPYAVVLEGRGRKKKKGRKFVLPPLRGTGIGMRAE